MCGLVGIVGREPVNLAIYDALSVLQHRGQDAAGIVTSDGRHVYTRKRNGLVRDVFQQKHMERLVGAFGIGHVRYPTAGCSSALEAQPFYVNSPYGICLAHNGNLTNSQDLSDMLVREDMRHLNTGSDTEALLNVFAHELQGMRRPRPLPSDIFAAAAAVHRRCSGGYAVIAMLVGHGIVGIRDPHGIRPLVLGKRETDRGAEYMLASESVALDALGFELVRDVDPGEAIFITDTGELHAQQCALAPSLTPCIFEYVYFARPDSIIDNVSVYKARLRMGEKLAERILGEWPDHDVDVVIPVPDTSRTAALQVAHHLGVKNREGFIKNRYVGRTFIMPQQENRERNVRAKLTTLPMELEGKKVLLIDDSVVRGTTTKATIAMVREAGARKVYFASAAPPVRHPNVYGIDMPAVGELIAHGRTVEEIAEKIGADRLFYQDLDDLVEAVSYDRTKIDGFDTSCFSGEYVTGDVSDTYLKRLELERSDDAKAARADHRNGEPGAAAAGGL